MKTINPKSTRIGWIGCGVMGASMCGHLIDAGYPVAIFSRTQSKAASLIERGGKWCPSPQSVAECSDVIFSIVGYPNDVNEVHLGENGTLLGAAAGSIIVDMTTSQPKLAEKIYAAAKAKGMTSVDAPVSGGDIGAANGTLSIMVGGDEDVFTCLKPLWDLMGRTAVYQGAAGSGQHTKMVNQTLIATNMIGVCEALLYAQRAGLNLETVMQSVSSGAAGSWSLSNLGPRIIGNDFDPGFFVEHFIKDLGIALEHANQMGLALPGLALAKQLYQAVAAQGGDRYGTQALQLALAAMSGVDWRNR